MWREDRIQELLSNADADVLFLSGCAPNQGKFYPQFDHVVLLTAPWHVIEQRLATRTNNPYGKRPEELAAVLEDLRAIEPTLREAADHEVDADAPLDEVVEKVLMFVGAERRAVERESPGKHSAFSSSRPERRELTADAAHTDVTRRNMISRNLVVLTLVAPVAIAGRSHLYDAAHPFDMLRKMASSVGMTNWSLRNASDHG